MTPQKEKASFLPKENSFFKKFKSGSAYHDEHSLNRYSSIKLNSVLYQSSSVASRVVNNYKAIKDNFNEEEILIE